MTELHELIFKLCRSNGVSGEEEAVSKIVAKELSNYADVHIDNRFNNVFGRIGRKDAEKRILLDAHIDQIGFIVTCVEKGFLKIAPCGSFDNRILPGSAIKIFGKKEILGIVCSIPPHLVDKSNNKFTEDIVIDTTLTEEDAEELVPIGSYGTFWGSETKLSNNRICAQGLDNRSSVAVLIFCAKLLNKMKIDWQNFNCNINFLFSSREEIGGHVGAAIGSYAIKPTEAIVLDVSFATQYDVDRRKARELSKGPLIGLAPSLSRRIADKFVGIADKNEIPYQFEVMGNKTSTNADVIGSNMSGVETFLISLPLRYMHTQCEVMDLEDIKNAINLIFSYLLHSIK
ncbi:MAG: M42 family peptidase [Oscillospiraceae bacterium]|nr:M42 family peptidase [Oscillospiraceae bacterium]